MIRINTEDIRYAEDILLPKGSHFDVERIDFIKNLDTIDLQAVPWSGKTTALLAKLLILERYMPFDDWAWILVLSHTNTAVDEIKSKIWKYCPKLFTYPNFIGTIQSFVDKFLATPYYVHKYWKKPYRIDNEIYDEKIKAFLKSPRLYKLGFDNNLFRKIQHIANNDQKKIYNFRLWFDEDKKIILLNSLNKEKLQIKKPKWNTKKENYNDYPQNEKDELYRRFLLFKKHLIENDKILHFDDAYFLAELYLQKFPQIKSLLQKRFKLVFVDEMQDMDIHQYVLLEELFYEGDENPTKYQRIWDVNQAIHNNISSSDSWECRENSLKLSWSHRLTEEVAEIVKYFGLQYQEILGLRKGVNIKPHIIVFEDPKKVLPKFAELIKNNRLSDEKHPFCAIGRTSKYKYTDKEKTILDKEKLCIKHYHEDFEKDQQKPKIDYDELRSYLKYYEKSSNPLAPIRKNILKIFVKILRKENIKDENNNNYTTRKFISFLKERYVDEYEELKLKLFEWSFSINKWEDVYIEVKNYIEWYKKTIFPDIKISQDTKSFIVGKTSSIQESTGWYQKDCCVYQEWGIKVQIGTVHSVKWATHTATLYLESYYYSDGGKSYESQRLVDPIKGSSLPSKIGSRVKQSIKMAYVGFSRPTHLLCFAIHKDRLPKDLDKNKWEIIELE